MEGEALSRRSGELEATVRRLRTAARDGDAERERLTARLAALEASLSGERERAATAAAAAAAQARGPSRVCTGLWLHAPQVTRRSLWFGFCLCSSRLTCIHG